MTREVRVHLKPFEVDIRGIHSKTTLAIWSFYSGKHYCVLLQQRIPGSYILNRDEISSIMQMLNIKSETKTKIKEKCINGLSNCHDNNRLSKLRAVNTAICMFMAFSSRFSSGVIMVILIIMVIMVFGSG